ncbi:hypothetical protein L1987_52440 [Smallanthus sonchifolius]|uniref:Uncharacterized protein n=1 Tax=Smallanthus sonchifolius TaxID=185202 RepID=A0ACB9ET57_9ASTR|nr:hypothetical protein L1987_52440 [Smallanthus sonchifolius]
MIIWFVLFLILLIISGRHAKLLVALNSEEFVLLDEVSGSEVTDLFFNEGSKLLENSSWYDHHGAIFLVQNFQLPQVRICSSIASKVNACLSYVLLGIFIWIIVDSGDDRPRCSKYLIVKKSEAISRPLDAEIQAEVKSDDASIVLKPKQEVVTKSSMNRMESKEQSVLDVLDDNYTKAKHLAFKLRRPHKLFELFGALCRIVKASGLINATVLEIKDGSHQCDESWNTTDIEH